jgi:hypothetical protein
MNYTLNELQARVAALIKQQGGDSVCAAWIYTGEDVIRYDDDGNEVQQPKELRDTVLKNMYDVDYIHQAIGDAIGDELDYKLDGCNQMGMNF